MQGKARFIALVRSLKTLKLGHMEIRKGSSRTMKEQKNRVQKENRFAQYAMISVRWHECIEIMGYKVVGLVAKSVMLYIYKKEIILFIVILFCACYLILLNERRGLFKSQVFLNTHWNLNFFFLIKYILKM